MLTLEGLSILSPLSGVLLEAVTDEPQHNLELWVVRGFGVGQCAILGVRLLGLGTLCRLNHPIRLSQTFGQ